MPSPFPGMDPYLESRWGDVHQGIATYTRDQLQLVLPAGLRARLEERVYLEGEFGGRGSYPDVRVVEQAHEARKERRGGELFPQKDTDNVALASLS